MGISVGGAFYGASKGLWVKKGSQNQKYDGTYSDPTRSATCLARVPASRPPRSCRRFVLAAAGAGGLLSGDPAAESRGRPTLVARRRVTPKADRYHTVQPILIGRAWE